MPPRSPAPGHGSSRTFWQKLAIYLAGVAIGLMFLGWIQIRKRQAAGPPPAPAETVPAESQGAAEPNPNPGGG